MRHGRRSLTNLVSIPVGFSRSLQLMRHCPARSLHCRFQSLSGFHARCNRASQACRSRWGRVSIPVGFSRSLQLNNLNTLLKNNRMFQSLSGFHARCNMPIPPQGVLRSTLFQSLSGFHARCNYNVIPAAGPDDLVSIPVGFSRSLQRCRMTQPPIPMSQFQSLSGFHARCNASS